MSNLVIVAVPHPDDYVWKISSEKVPHMTILFLGDATANPNVTKITEFLEHASQTVLEPFWLEVDHRGTLGPDNADVLFFEGSWELPELKNFRSQLLKNDNIKKAFDAVPQYDEWQPHLTLGYPPTPAKPDTRDYPGIQSVRFDRIALWFGDYTGPEFQLKSNYLKYPMEVSMSDVKGRGAGAVSDILAHHGVKGMKWGVHRDRTPSDVAVKAKGKKLVTEGGKNHGPHADAINAAKIAQKAMASGTHTLSNQELADLATRMNLEQNVGRLQSNQASGPKAFIKKLLADTGKQQAHRVANDVATKKVDKLLSKKDAKS